MYMEPEISSALKDAPLFRRWLPSEVSVSLARSLGARVPSVSDRSNVQPSQHNITVKRHSPLDEDPTALRWTDGRTDGAGEDQRSERRPGHSLIVVEKTDGVHGNNAGGLTGLSRMPPIRSLLRLGRVRRTFIEVLYI